MTDNEREMQVERLQDLRYWARSRIDHCRREEAKFGAAWTAVEASVERRALEAVLRILDGGEQ